MKKQKRWQLLGLLIAVVFIASGCVRYDSQGNPTGSIYELFGKPATSFLEWIANIFGGSYGMAIIIVTLITRLFMLPSSIKMTKDSMINQARMKVAQPEIDEIRAEMDATTDPTEKTQLNQELMDVYKRHNISMTGGLSGCLPLLVQLPIISVVYAAIRSSEAIKNSHFFGISLGDKSVALVIAVVIVYFVQGWLMQIQMDSQMKKSADETGEQEKEKNAMAQTMQNTSKTMIWLNPIMLGWISYTSAAGLALYFLTGGIFALGQQLYTNHIVRPKIQEILDEEAKNRQPVQARKRVAKTTAKQSHNTGKLIPTKTSAAVQGRNAGKQRRK